MFAGLGSGLCLDDLPTARGDRVRRRSPDTANSRCDGRRIRSQGEYGLDGQRGVVGDGVELGLVLPPLEVPLTSEANVDGEMEKSNAVVTWPVPDVPPRSDGVLGEANGRGDGLEPVELLLLHMVGRLVNGERGDLCETIDCDPMCDVTVPPRGEKTWLSNDSSWPIKEKFGEMILRRLFTCS